MTECYKNQPIIIQQTSGYLSISPRNQNMPGSVDCPWRIEAPSGTVVESQQCFLNNCYLKAETIKHYYNYILLVILVFQENRYVYRSSTLIFGDGRVLYIVIDMQD